MIKSIWHCFLVEAEIGTCRQYRHSARPVSGDGVPILAFIDQKSVPYLPASNE